MRAATIDGVSTFVLRIQHRCGNDLSNIRLLCDRLTFAVLVLDAWARRGGNVFRRLAHIAPAIFPRDRLMPYFHTGSPAQLCPRICC
jgi:hypothetical protein